MNRANANRKTKESESVDSGLQNVTKGYLDGALAIEPTEVVQQEPKFSHTDVASLVDDVAKAYSCEPPKAYAGICCTLQGGGSNSNKRSKIKITIAGTQFESSKINEAIRKHLKVSPRQFAKAIADDIFQVSKRHGITGNAYVSLRRFYSQLLTEATDAEKFWASDFQLDNPNCPEYIRNALRQRYIDKFSGGNRKK